MPLPLQPILIFDDGIFCRFTNFSPRTSKFRHSLTKKASASGRLRYPLSGLCPWTPLRDLRLATYVPQAPCAPPLHILNMPLATSRDRCCCCCCYGDNDDKDAETVMMLMMQVSTRPTAVCRVRVTALKASVTARTATVSARPACLDPPVSCRALTTRGVPTVSTSATVTLPTPSIVTHG